MQRNNKKTIESFILENRTIAPSNTKAMDSSFKSSLFEKMKTAHAKTFSKAPRNWKEKIKAILKQPKYLALIIGSLIIIGSLGVTLYLIYNVDNEQPEETEDVEETALAGTLTLTEGTVEYNTFDDEDKGWLEAEEDLELKEGMGVRTLANSRAVIELWDESALRLNENTTILLTTLTEESVAITNEEGELYTRVVEDGDREFAVVIEDSILFQAEGTAYSTINLDDTKGVEVFHNEITIDGIEDTPIQVEEGERYFITSEISELNDTVTSLDLEEIREDEFIIWCREQDAKNTLFENQLGILEDLDAPDLDIIEPANNTKTSEDTIQISGKTESDVTLTINGEFVNVDGEGLFSHQVSLIEGENTFEVIAEDDAGNTSKQVIKVTREVEEQPAINLSGTATTSGIQLNWSIVNLDVSGGFKIVAGAVVNPTYPTNFFDDANSGERSYSTTLTTGQVYHFRICRYLPSSNTCTNYSNDIIITAPTLAVDVNSITISDAGTGLIEWVIDGDAPYGVMVVWVKDTQVPTYPPSGGSQNYLSSSPNDGSYQINAYDGSGTYYVRVCAYNGATEDTCNAYSNEVTVTFP